MREGGREGEPISRDMPERHSCHKTAFSNGILNSVAKIRMYDCSLLEGQSLNK